MRHWAAAARGRGATMPKKINWTPAQSQGITTTGQSLLVSAAAGSGKTAMLAARCAYLVCDAPDPCNVDELLVVTFTEAAAAEMKSRIHTALRDRAAEAPSARLDRQLALVNHASVGTLHSFCARMLREHFHLVGLDPAFNVLDGEEAGLLRREVGRALFDDRYELDASGDFHRFIDAYGEGDDARLVRLVIQTHEMLGSLVDPLGWIDRARTRINDAAAGELSESALGKEFARVVGRAVADIRSQCDRATDLVRQLGSFPGYVAALKEAGQILRHWDELLRDEGIDALAESVTTLKHPPLARVPNSVPGKEQAKKAVDSVRKAMNDGALKDLLRFSSAQWQAGLRAITPHAEVFLGLVEDFGRRYRDAKDAARVVDFSDLERFALGVLCETSAAGGKLMPSPAARAYHRRYAHVLVDEYQDINELQDAILSLLSRECVHGERGWAGNFFCVGDVKQSIYRFRLAETGRFLERQKLFREPTTTPPRGRVIDLQSNFRSRAALLEAVNGVFERLMTEDAADIEYDQTHRLHAGLPYPAGGAPAFVGAPIEMHLLPADLTTEEHDEPAGDDADLDRSEREAVLVAQRIRRLTGADGGAPAMVTEADGAGGFRQRPVRFRDVVILLRSMRYKSEQYADVLRRAGIPVHAQSGTGYFESTEIRDMLALLGVLDNQRQDIPLAAVLRSPLANLPEAESCFARVRIAYPAGGGKDAPAFHDAVVRYAQEKDDELAAALRDFLAKFARWRVLAHSRPLAEVVWEVYEQTGYLAFCAGLHDGEQRVANLKDFHRRAAQFGSFRRQGLSRFMQFLESLRDEVDLGQPSTASEADDVVRIMSIHRSKGLEFPVVVLPDLGKRINFSDCQGAIVADRAAGLGMSVVDEERMIRYPSLAQVLVQRRLKQQALAEELRVLYVAMTRAKEHLILIGTCEPKTADGWGERWAGHDGAFPADAILGARCMLDWLGPVSVAAGAGVIDVTRHSAEEVAGWQSAHAKRPELSERQRELAEMRPLDAAPSDDSVAAGVIGRLEHRYKFDAFTRVQAAQAVTALAKAGGAVFGENAKELAGPRFLAGTAASPAEVGTATHRVLLHLDFSCACDDADLKSQIDRLVSRKLLTAAEAEMVDRDRVRWFLESPIGRTLRSGKSRLHREVPVHFAAPAPGASSDDACDQVMVRGRIDLLAVGEGGGAVLVDYKTDNVPASAVPHRARMYGDQLAEYRRAVERMTGKPVAGAYLVFLTPRVIHSL